MNAPLPPHRVPLARAPLIGWYPATRVRVGSDEDPERRRWVPLLAHIGGGTRMLVVQGRVERRAPGPLLLRA